MALEKRILAVVVLPDGSTINSESATRVEIVDEGGGEFVEVTQYGSDIKGQMVRIDAPEWPTVRQAIDEMIANVKS